MRRRLRRLGQPHNLLLLLFTAVAGVSLLFRVTSTPNSCASCHEMKAVVASFKTSSHAAMGCMGCHTDPGQINFVKAKITDGAKDVYGHLFGYQKPIHTSVPNARCLSCHLTIHSRNTFRQLEVAHDKHLAKNVSCMKCHQRVGHQSMTLAAADRDKVVAVSFDQTHKQVTLQTCFASGCHDGRNESARTTCATCHSNRQRVKPKSHAPGFLNTHGARAVSDPRGCLTCHKAEPTLTSWLRGEQSKTSARISERSAFTQLMSSKSCTECHATKNPHPPDFERNHNDRATAPNADCATCHKDKKQFCDACHSLPMPHPQGFNDRHGRIAKRATTKCEYCHEKQQCEGCHHSTRPQSHTPDFREKHGAIAKVRVESCMLCHRKSTCDSCHQLPMPHPAKYAASHTVDASKKESACANCHRKKDCLKCHEKDEIHLPNVRREESGPHFARERDPMKQLVQWLREAEPRCPRMRSGIE